MKVIICENYEEASQKAADIMLEVVKDKPTANLGLATGSTPIKMYELMVKDHKENGTSYQDIKSYNLDEFRKAKGILLEEKEKLVNEGIAVSDNFQVGIMIEIPAAAVLADQFAKEVDFFSIGTNDLVQYTFAADRMSSGVSYLYQPFHPSILRLIKHVIESSHKEGKWTGMCGEMAGEAIAAPLLIGLGLDEFSMSATSILAQRKLIRSMKKSEMNELAAKAINCSTMDEVVALVKEYIEL